MKEADRSIVGCTSRQVMARTSSKSSRACAASEALTADAYTSSRRWVSTSFAEA